MAARALGGSADDEVPVRTRPWCVLVMVPLAVFCCLAQASFTAQPYLHSPADARFVWMIVSALLAFVFPFTLVFRSRRPALVFWAAAAVTLIFPYDPMMTLMALTSLLARRSSRRGSMLAVAGATLVTVWAQVRDVLNGPDASIWYMFFAAPNTGVGGVPVEPLAGRGLIGMTAAIVAVIEVTIATLVGLHIRSRASLQTAKAQADAATTHAATLQNDLDSQQLADAIAAEAHDTLAHSLSLLALNASALQAEAGRLDDSPASRSLAGKAEDIRRQAAGALDEAHQIIDMLRHPDTAWKQLAPSDETALTRESLDTLIGQARAAGMGLDTWIDIRDLSGLDDMVAKTAYRAIQEGLTNARRHAPGAPVSLEVNATPATGVHVHVSNPVPPEPAEAAAVDAQDEAEMPATDIEFDGQSPTSTRHTGAGLPGLTARAQSAGGTCSYGLDERGAFHLDVLLPWRS